MAPSEPNLDEIPNRVSVRTDPDAGYAKRFKTIHDAQHALDASSKTRAILAACRHVEHDRRGKRRALEYLAERLPPGELLEVCRLLSTPELSLAIAVDSTADNPVNVEVGE